MNFDLTSMNRKELDKLMRDVQDALQTIQAKERREAREAVEKVAAKFGFSLNELTDGGKNGKNKTAGTKSKPQFANPDDLSQTWTGKGRQPNWYRAQVEKGILPESMKIE